MEFIPRLISKYKTLSFLITQKPLYLSQVKRFLI